MHASIDSTEKSKIGCQRCDIGKRSIAHAHCKDVICADTGHGGHVEPEHREATAMLAQVDAVHPDIRYRADAVEVNEQATSRFTCIDKKVTAIEAGTTIVVTATVLPVLRVPGMGNRNDIPTSIVEAFLFCASHIAFDEAPIIDQQCVASNLRRWRKHLRQSNIE